MPTAPVHQGCSAIQRSTSSASCCSSGRYSSWSRPPDSPLPRRSTRSAAYPCPAKYAWRDQSRGAVPSPLRYGMYSRIAGHGVALGVLGKPDAGAEPRAVGQRDPDVVDRAAPGAAGPLTTRISGSALEQLVRVLAEAGRRPAVRARATPSTLNDAAEQPHRAHARLLDRLDQPVGAHLLVVEELRRAGAPRSPARARAASAATASATPSRAKPASTARTCAARRSRSAGVGRLGLRVRPRAGPRARGARTRWRRCSALRQASATKPSAQACAR